MSTTYRVTSPQGEVRMIVGGVGETGALLALRAMARLCALPIPSGAEIQGIHQGPHRWQVWYGPETVLIAEVVPEACGTTSSPTAKCDCIHAGEHHCPRTGACFYTNPTAGPCPCAATPKPVREALEAAWSAMRRAVDRDKRSR